MTTSFTVANIPCSPLDIRLVAKVPDGSHTLSEILQSKNVQRII